MQMLALVIQGTRLNRRNQPDPSRSFPNKRSGRRGKMLTFVTALKYQKDNRRVSLYATLHQPSHCFLRLLFFSTNFHNVVIFASPASDPENMKRAVMEAAVL